MAKSGISSSRQAVSPAMAKFIQQNPTLLNALAHGKIVELHARDASRLVTPLTPDVVPTQVDPSNFSALLKQVDGLETALSCVILHNILNCVEDYRTLLAQVFEKIEVQGNLIIVVPHQLLLERKLQPSSSESSKRQRSYTPALLLAEIEESIDPFQYRLRSASDNDIGYDYGLPLSQPPAGASDIVVCLQKLALPTWRNQVEEIDRPSKTAGKLTRFLPPGEDAPYCVVSTQRKPSRKILILKLDHRGDFILAEDAFRIIRSSFPDAEITLCCGAWNVGAAQSSSLFDEVVPFNFFPEDASSVAEQISLSERCLAFERLFCEKLYDLAIDLRLYEETRQLLSLINANSRAGFDPYDTFPWLDIRLNIPCPTTDGRPEHGIFPAAEFEFLQPPSTHRGYDIIVETVKTVVPNKPLVWGPYCRLKPGHYAFNIVVEPMWSNINRLTGRLVGPLRRAVSKRFVTIAPPVVAELAYEFCCERGNRILQCGIIQISKEDSAMPISFNTSERIDDFELRLRPSCGTAPHAFRFLGLRYTRYAALIGVHQSEAMVLLANLIARRVKFPIRVH